MGRLIKNLQFLPPVKDYEIAPHRYLYNANVGNDASRIECIAEAPYRPGDVVYFDNGEKLLKARISHVFADKTYLEDWREKYRVQLETRAGQWSKLWKYIYPGQIQRGYETAGLAPEMPK